MSTIIHSELPWVVFQLDKQSFAISSTHVREMATFEGYVKVPKVPEHVRGVISVRGKVIPLLDLRAWLGLPSALAAANALVQELELREEDHKRWLTELEACARENRKFTLATDPHLCAFGRWYDAYTTDDTYIRALLREFDVPHQQIHSIAAKVTALAESGQGAQAQAIINETRQGVLAQMVRLFDQLRATIKTSLREIAMVMENHGQVLAGVVDFVESVEYLQDTFDEATELLQIGNDTRIQMVGRRKKDDTPVLIPDVECLFNHAQVDATVAVDAQPLSGAV